MSVAWEKIPETQVKPSLRQRNNTKATDGGDGDAVCGKLELK